MSLLKKIFILVNLILCMLCINIFASYTYQFDGSTYTISTDFEEEYPYLTIFRITDVASGYENYTVIFSKEPYYILHNGSNIYNAFYGSKRLHTYSKIIYDSDNLFPISGDLSNNENITLKFSDAAQTQYFGKYNSSTGEYISNKNYILYTNYDVIDSVTGQVYFYGNGASEPTEPPFDESTIDWENAFEYYVVPCNDLVNIEHVGETYNKNLTLLIKANNIDGLLNNEELHNNNIYYWLQYDIDFVFTDSNGNQHIRTLHNIQAFDDKFYSFDFPYLISEMGDDEQYNLLVVAWESYLAFWDSIPWPGPQGTEIWGYDTYGEDTQSFWNDIVEHFVDEYGYFDYDLILKPYVIKQTTYPEYIEEVIYTYDEKSLIYDISNPDYISPSDSSKIDSPDGFEDIGIIVGPDGDKIGEFDNNDDYDFDDDGNIVDKDGNVVAKPEIDKDNETINWTGPNGEDLGEHPFGDKLPTAEDQINGTLKDKNYDITGVIRGLKEDLKDLLKGNNGLNKVFQWFKDVFNWLPFGLLEIFGILVSFFIIFKFIDIIRK